LQLSSAEDLSSCNKSILNTKILAIYNKGFYCPFRACLSLLFVPAGGCFYAQQGGINAV